MTENRTPADRAFQEIAQLLGIEIANHAVTRQRLADVTRERDSFVASELNRCIAAP